MNRYQVLWIDDDAEKQDGFLDSAYLEGLDINYYKTSKEGMEELTSKIEQYDAVILDAMVYNESEDETEHAVVKISGNVIGKLYARNFLWMPWSMAEDADTDNKHADIQLTPSVATGMTFTWCCVNEGTEFPTSV